MISRPARLEDWSLALVHEIAASGLSENDWYDLKGNLQGQAEHQRKIVAAFANTQGGFLIFGVTNDRQVNGIDNTELPRDFGNKLTHGLTPSVSFSFAAPMTVSGAASVWVCEVPRSQRGPHAVLLNDHWIFPRRTESGSNVTMNVEEIRMAFQDTETRRIKLVHLSSELDHIGFLARHLLEDVPENAKLEGLTIDTAWTTRYPTTAIDLLLGDAFALVARKANLWTALQALRAEIRYSNSMAEAHADYQFIRTTGDTGGRARLYKIMRQRAQSIEMLSKQAKDEVDAALAGNAS